MGTRLIDFETGWWIHGMFVLINTCPPGWRAKSSFSSADAVLIGWGTGERLVGEVEPQVMEPWTEFVFGSGNPQ
jgi:hypothetical protein